ncbi:McrB family protein [Microvirga sp. Mcv34]|uniref:McrB family protein n=1 Tax=Microvirga sp. Mcv34 TaxID=2926016 RepID=UPI0021C5DAA4|nr:AAA family ATPase [Microvirga sp. Mcv34]
MDLNFFSISTALGAGAALTACATAAVAVLDAGRRTAALPTWRFLQEDIPRRQAEREEAQRALDALRAEIDTLRLETAQLETVRAQRTAEEALLADIQRQLDNLAEDRKQLDTLKTELVTLIDQKAALDQQLIDLRDEQSQRAKIVERLGTEREELERFLADRKTERESLEAETARLKVERDSLRHDGERARSELEELRRRATEETAALADARRRLEQGQAEETATLTRVAALRQDREEIETKLSEAAAGRGRLSEEIGRLSAEREGLREDLVAEQQAFLKARSEVEAAGLERDEARRERDGLRAESEVLKRVITNLEAKAGPRTEADVRDILGDLLVPPKPLVCAKMARVAEEEVTALDRVRQHLAARNLRFPERLIDAFHTSLKISDISPMTVLAGISGTGKSELPRQYATALGLPFFQLAVQPRWDSPQDLFGFYNYLEHRYKPTDLARLMIHLDVERWPEQARPYKDHMALVLLDEMNLARVEYYFSEFLSRLEVRRDSDTAAAAEIELELGRLPEGWSNRVYPVRRLLFVGTMNEDESTQTLSDKVVDRANVMRFPKPRTLATNRDGTSSEAADDNFLPFTVWQRWIRKDAPATLDTWLATLNSHLESLGRPFGHRMGQAIRAYVANHPKSRTDIRIPMADQLEMRIFPKLRGVVVDENRAALDGIARFIDQELKDPSLQEAFDQAHRDRDLFLWRGVDRG